MAHWLRACSLWLVVGLALGACRTRVVEPLPGPGDEAMAAMQRANELLRHGTYSEQARGALLEAIEAAPDWEVPRRRLDDLARENLLGPKALRAHWQALHAGEALDLHAYLGGRLNKDTSAQRFLQSHRTQPRNPWALHGMAFVAAGQGRLPRALAWQKQAMDLAREPEERRLFSLAMARYLREAGDVAAACSTLGTLWESMEPGGARDGVELEWLTSETALGTETDLARAKARAARLLREGDISRSQLGLLVGLGILDAEESRAWLYLRPSKGSTEQWAQELSGRLLWSQDPHASPHGWWTLSNTGRSVRTRTVELFRSGQAMEGWMAWRNSLPTFMGDFASHRPELKRLQESIAEYEASDELDSSPASWKLYQRVLDDLMDAGWMDEAQAFARNSSVADSNLDPMILESQATLGKRTLAALGELMERVDRGHPALEPSGSGNDHDGVVRSLDELLQAVGQVLWTAGPRFYGERTKLELEEALVASPRLGFGPFAQVVHPGPTLAPWDAHRKLGSTNDPVPGLAQELARLGRIGIFGSAVGAGAPDASILRLVYAQPIEGEHLGVPFQGTVLWCDGADVGARNVRMGANVSGAALHEGYFIDLHEVRVTHARWQRLSDRFQADGSTERLQRLREILADPGLPTHAPDLLPMGGKPQFHPDLDRDAAPVDPWVLTHALLGQADRNRLAWMGENAQEQGLDPGSLLPPSFDDAVRLTAIHEEGHLCERTRYLPLSEHWYAALGFLAAQDFSPIKIQERLEYRAQLVALCEVPDPRLALIEILDLAEGSASGLPHGPAYAELLRDLVGELGAGLRQNAPWLRGLQMDEEHRLVFQLHRVPVEALRATALRVAAREGLIGADYLGK